MVVFFKSTFTSWIYLGKPDLGMTINGCLAGLVGITGSCAYVSVLSSLIIGAIAGVLVVFLVVFFDKIKIDDPVGATSVHLGCGTFGTLCVGLFAQEGVTSLSTRNGLFFGGGFGLLGTQIVGILAIGIFGFVTTALVWLALKKTIGIRVSTEEEIAGLDIGEHGNMAYPDFAPISAAPLSGLSAGAEEERVAAAVASVPKEAAEASEQKVPVIHKERTAGPKMTKVTIVTNQSRFSELESTLARIGVTGLTISNVFGYGMQKGHETYFRGAPVESRLLPKVKIDVVICKIPTETVVNAVQKVLCTGNVGDGKIFVYDVEDVVKVRTNEHGYDALQDEE